MKTIKISDIEMLTIAIGLDQMDNTGMWSDDLPMKKADKVHKAMKTLRGKIELLPEPTAEEVNAKIIERVKKKFKHKNLDKFTFVDGGVVLGVKFASPMGNLTYACSHYDPKGKYEDLVEYISQMIKHFR